MLSALAAFLLAAVPTCAPAERPCAPGAAWRTVAAYDEVHVEADTASLIRAADGTLGVRLRWRFAVREVAPATWDAGVRATLDRLEVDCAAGQVRTVASHAYDADGALVAAMSFRAVGGAWTRPGAASVAGEVAEQVCRLAEARTGR